MSPPRLSGKVALITGAASGFGRGIATKFLSEGAHVLIADLDTTAGQKTADELNSLLSSSSSSSASPSVPTAIFHRADVTSQSDWTALLQAALDKWGHLDIVVNNAGATYANKPTETVTERDFDLCFNVNVKSIWLSTVVLLPYFLDAENKRQAGDGQAVQGGCFINVASTAGTRPRPGLAWYNASKAAVINASKFEFFIYRWWNIILISHIIQQNHMLTTQLHHQHAAKSLAVEYGPKQIRFNSVAPVFGSGTGL